MTVQFKRGFGRKIVNYISYFLIFLIIVTVTVIIHDRYRVKLYHVQGDARDEDTAYYSAISNNDKSTSKGTVQSERNTEKGANLCDTIHIAAVCGGFNSTRSFYVLLKSILFYRTDLIQIHLFVDDISRTILTELFRTWIVPDLSVHYYNITNYEQEIWWITSNHYSHRYGLMKLVFLSVLSDETSLEKVIFLDTDMLVLGNINQVWRKFKDMKAVEGVQEPVFGMVENQSDWYLGDDQLTGSRSVWPAIGRGFNSGLILAKLIGLKRLDWKRTWRQVAESELITHLSTPLADQDIFNAVIRLHNHMINQLPCSFNLQLNDHTKLNEVCPSENDFKIIHWNSPFKLLSKNPKAQLYNNWYITFTNWDGKLLEQSYCGKINIDDRQQTTNSSSDLEIICKDIRPRPRQRLRTYLYFLEFACETSEYDVTLVVNLSLDRLQVLDQLANHWPGPISAAIYLSELETNLFLESIRNGDNLAQRSNIGYHLVFRDHGFNYPINRLRNVALNNAITPYVFLSDVDFLPSKNLYGYLKQTISDLSRRDEVIDSLVKRALVIPAFENLQYKFEFPSNKVELLTQLNLGSVSMFRDQIWPRGQAPTNYVKWRSSTKPYKVNWKPEYEPFIVTSRNVPRFDERFVGFGWNKVESIVQLAALDYEFLVLPEAFVIHKFHSASFDIMKHRESHEYQTCVKKVKKVFLAEIKMKFPDFFELISAKNRLVSDI